MALILITGAMGTGKTALAIKHLLESEHYPRSAFIFGVRGWKGAGHYRELPGDQPQANQQLFEELGRISHSVYLVDEAKKVWPSRVAGRPVPPFIDNQLAESRSVSQDWILTAQAPGQIDVKVRHLVTKHIHLEKTPLGIRYSEAGSCRDDLKFSREESRKYEFPVDSLKLYDTDEGETVHQKKGLKLPRRLVFMLGLIVVLIGTIAYFASNSRLFNEAVEAQAQPAGFMQQASGFMGGVPETKKPEVLPVTHAPGPEYYRPSNTAYPELAKAPRYPVSCLASMKTSRCSCYDQAGQFIDKIGFKRCMNIIAGNNELAVLYPEPEPEGLQTRPMLKQPQAQPEPPAREGGGDSPA